MNLKKGNTTTGAILGGVIVIGVAIFLIYLFNSTSKETKIIISDSTIVIEGMYGETYNLRDISSVELKDSIPKIITRTNGAAIGESKKGNFNVQELGKCKLFVLSNEGPYVSFLAGEQYVIINYKDKVKTEKLYSNLSAKVTK